MFPNKVCSLQSGIFYTDLKEFSLLEHFICLILRMFPNKAHFHFIYNLHFANRMRSFVSNSQCERCKDSNNANQSKTQCERLNANLKHRIACDLSIKWKWAFTNIWFAPMTCKTEANMAVIETFLGVILSSPPQHNVYQAVWLNSVWGTGEKASLPTFFGFLFWLNIYIIFPCITVQ